MVETDVTAENKPACSPQVYMVFTQRSRECEKILTGINVQFRSSSYFSAMGRLQSSAVRWINCSAPNAENNTGMRDEKGGAEGGKFGWRAL